jgi:hypothetical protein
LLFSLYINRFYGKEFFFMGNYLIMTDTSADVPQDFLDRYTLGIIPMVYEIGDEEYIHDRLDNWEYLSFF